MSLYVLRNRVTGQFAMRSCMGQRDGNFSDDPADAKEFHSYGDCADFGQNFDDDWHPEDLFPDQHVPVSVSFAPGARCSDLDEHPFSGAVSAGDY